MDIEPFIVTGISTLRETHGCCGVDEPVSRPLLMRSVVHRHATTNGTVEPQHAHPRETGRPSVRELNSPCGQFRSANSTLKRIVGIVGK